MSQGPTPECFAEWAETIVAPCANTPGHEQSALQSATLYKPFQPFPCSPPGASSDRDPGGS